MTRIMKFIETCALMVYWYFEVFLLLAPEIVDCNLVNHEVDFDYKFMNFVVNDHINNINNLPCQLFMNHVLV